MIIEANGRASHSSAKTSPETGHQHRSKASAVAAWAGRSYGNGQGCGQSACTRPYSLLSCTCALQGYLLARGHKPWLMDVPPVSSKNARASSMIDLLLDGCPPAGPEPSSPLRRVIARALWLLQAIHHGLPRHSERTVSEGGLKKTAADYLYEPNNRRLVFGLLDLISLEGVYPQLSTGVGVPIERRLKSVLPPGAITSRAQPTRRMLWMTTAKSQVCWRWSSTACMPS